MNLGDLLRAFINRTKNYKHLSDFYLQDAQIELAETIEAAIKMPRPFRIAAFF